jgi:hypothetical protein
MRNIFTLALIAVTMACGGLQTANAGLLGMPLNLHAAIEAANTNPVSSAPAPVYPRYVDDIFAGADLVIEC